MMFRNIVLLVLCIFVFCGFEYPTVKNDSSVESAVNVFKDGGSGGYPSTNIRKISDIFFLISPF